MPSAPSFPITIFYDGSCSVCAAEIEQYRRQDHAARLVLIDISDPGFNPQPYQIDRQAFLHELHVIDRNGTIYRGVEAFWAIWQAFPTSTLYGILGSVITLPLINPLARLCYRGFARIRRYLPKSKNTCDNGTCRIRNKE